MHRTFLEGLHTQEKSFRNLQIEGNLKSCLNKHSGEQAWFIKKISQNIIQNLDFT